MINRRLFLRRLGLNSAGLLLVPSFGPGAIAALGTRQGAGALPRSTPEEQGISSAAILDFLGAVKLSGQEFHSFMIIRHGHVVAEGWWSPFTKDNHQQLYSLSKSFTGTAIGMAADEKRLTIEDPVLSFFPDDHPATISDNLASLKVKHLLSMSVGHAKDSVLTLEASPAGTRWEKTFLGIPVVYEPGTRFLYNSGASYMLSSIVSKVTGMSVHEYLRPRLYKHLGITGATWTENAEGVNMGASNLRIRTEDIGKFGLLYLQRGAWGGKQLVSQDWVALAGKKEISTGTGNGSWSYGYGYQFWMNPPGGFRADGAYGQYSMIFPDKDTVVAITSESADKETTMDTVWNHIYPALGSGVLAPNPTDHARLVQESRGLVLPPPAFDASSSVAARISGKRFVLDKNQFNAKAVSFRFDGDKTIFTLMEDGEPDIVITCGSNAWIVDGNRKPRAHSLFSLRRIDFDSPVAASAGWKDAQTLVLTLRYLEAIHGDTFTCIFDGDRLRMQFLFSGAKMDKRPDERPEIDGRVEA